MQGRKTKHLKRSLLLLAVSLLLPGGNIAFAEQKDTTAGPTAVRSTEDLVQWMTYYYLHPQPDLLVPALIYADQNGLVEKGEAPLTAFVSQVFATNPKRIANWVPQLDALSSKSKQMVWSALWWANTVEAKEALNKLVVNLPQKSQEVLLAQMGKPPEAIEAMEIKSPEVLDELWGAFSATGDEKYVYRLMTALPWTYDTNGDYNKLTIGGAARWSLVSNAQQHPKVLKICQKARETHPEWKKALDVVLAEASKNSHNQQASTPTAQ